VLLIEEADSMFLDRNFVIGYILPATAFLAVSLGLINAYGLLPDLLPLAETYMLLSILITFVVILIGGVCLFIINRAIVRFMEGYGKFNPAKLFAWVQKRRYEQLQETIDKLDEQFRRYISDGKEFPDELRKRRNELILQRVGQFPDQEIWILPTAFGNTIRAFEVYPRVMYGLESIQGWVRLLAVIPKEYRELVETAKVHTDFWVNFWFISLLVMAEYVSISLYTWELRMPLLPVIVLVVALFASYRARKAAYGWGEWVKASFDVFLPELRTKLGFPPPETMDEEQEFWKGFSQAIIYRFPSSMAIRFKSHKKDSESSTQ
jgi:hypothetical protein